MGHRHRHAGSCVIQIDRRLHHSGKHLRQSDDVEGRSRSGKPGLAQSKPGEFEGGIAESWSLEKDGATLVLNVRKGATFPSGKPVNAAAVKYLFDRGLQSPGYMRILFPRLLRITKPEQIEVRDDYTVALNMPAPSPMTLDTMCLINNALLDPDEVKANATAEDPWATAWLKRNPAGLGPYKLVKNEPGVEIVIEAQKGHWRKPAPFFERVVFKFVPNEADRVLLLKRKAVDMVVGGRAFPHATSKVSRVNRV